MSGGVRIGEIGVGVGVGGWGRGGWGRGSWGWGREVGVPDRNTNPLPEPHRFPCCVKSSSRQVACVKFVRIKSSASNCHVPICLVVWATLTS